MRFAIFIALAMVAGCKSEVDIRRMCIDRGYAAGVMAGERRIEIGAAVQVACLSEHGLKDH